MTKPRLNTCNVITVLAEAGDAGMTTTEIVEALDTGRREHMPASNRVNQILREKEKDGIVRRGAVEPSHRYRHSPVRRWHAVFPAAADYLSLPSADERRAIKQERMGLWAQQAREREAARLEVLSRAAAEVAVMYAQAKDSTRGTYGTRGMTKCWRRKKITELRATRLLTLDDIGRLFGLTRERVRMIELGRETPCACPECRVPAAGVELADADDRAGGIRS